MVFTATQVTDAGLELVKGMTSLDMLSLSSPQVTDAGLEHLKRLTNLRFLSLNDTQVTDAGLEHLKGQPFIVGFSPHICVSVVILPVLGRWIHDFG